METLSNLAPPLFAPPLLLEPVPDDLLREAEAGACAPLWALPLLRLPMLTDTLDSYQERAARMSLRSRMVPPSPQKRIPTTLAMKAFPSHRAKFTVLPRGK